MKNFREAKKIVDDYRKLRLNKEAKNEFRLQDKLKEIGYTTDSFKEEESLNNLKGIEINYCDIDNTISSINNQFSSSKNSILFNIPTKKSVYTGKNEYNKDYCDTNNITILDLGYSGGTIVVSDKDLGISFVLDNEIEQIYLTKKISEIISRLFKTAEINGNDILIDGYKICGCVYINKGGKHAYMYQISFETDIELIKNICLKEMVKIPRGLNYFRDNTREDLINEIKIWLQQ